MKRKTYLFVLAVLSLGLGVGCKPAAENNTSEAADESTQRQIARTEAAVDDAKRDWDAYTYAQKSQFIASMEVELAAINRSIDELEVRIGRSAGDAKAAATLRLNELRHQSDLLRANLDAAKDSTASTWDTVKATTREAYDDLTHNFNNARQWMSEKIEP